MIDLCVDKNRLGPWICKKISMVWGPEGRECVGIVDGERILGAVLFEDYAGLSMKCHVAIANEHAPIRKLITAAARYAFIDIGVEKLVGIVNSNNKRALNFDLRIGFDACAILPRMYADGGDAVILMMERKNCVWIPAEFRKAA